MDPVLQLLILLAGFGLYAWADRQRLLSLARPYLAPLQRIYRTARQELRPAGAPAPYVSPNRALLADGRRWLLVGAPGSGKSTAARQLVRAYHNAGAQVLILDLEGAMWPEESELSEPGMTTRQCRLSLSSLRSWPGCDGRPSSEIVADLARHGRKLAILVMWR